MHNVIMDDEIEYVYRLVVVASGKRETKINRLRNRSGDHVPTQFLLFLLFIMIITINYNTT